MFFHQNELSNKIVAIENGFGEKSSFTYLPLTNNLVYTKGTQAQYPLVDIQFPLFMLFIQIKQDVMSMIMSRLKLTDMHQLYYIRLVKGFWVLKNNPLRTT
jgi:hypothetical protein